MHTGAGLGFKPEHFTTALPCSAPGMWYEIHAENYMVAGGARLAMLDELSAKHPISVHGVGLSLAADAQPDREHLLRLKAVVDRTQAFLVSEHLAWCTSQNAYFPDLLPFPRTTAALQRIARNIDIAQDVLQRPLLIENPSSYLSLDGHEWDEAEFLGELAARTGCGLLVDINNIYVSMHNVGGSALRYLQALPAKAVGEIHIAGHVADKRGEVSLLIDNHGAPICHDVWQLYEFFISLIGPRPTLIERDDNIPPFEELLIERERAASLMTATFKRELSHADAC